MNTVFVLPPGENWIVDRFVKEWYEDNPDICTNDPAKADVIWLLADWCWQRLPFDLLEKKKVITTLHHVVPEKFGPLERIDFMQRDLITDVYHVPNQRTLQFIRQLTQKPIHEIPYWANQRIWCKTGNKQDIRDLLCVPRDAFVIGSFQRDTEGSDLVSPKREKGPDLLADAIIKLAKSQEPPIHVLLGGWRRQYIIARLKKAHVKYTYIELPPQHIINDMYQALDLYLITARYEGGPQALLECGLLGIPCRSRPVGMVEHVLPREAIHADVCLATSTVPDVSRLTLPEGYEPYRTLIDAL